MTFKPYALRACAPGAVADNSTNLTHCAPHLSSTFYFFLTHYAAQFRWVINFPYANYAHNFSILRRVESATSPEHRVHELTSTIQKKIVLLIRDTINAETEKLEGHSEPKGETK